MSELKAAKTNKKSLKSNISRFKEKVKSTIEEADAALLHLYESKISYFQAEVKHVFDSIFSYCDDTDIDAFITEKETILDNLDEINLIIKRKHLKSSTVKINTNENISPKDISVSEVKLPKLSLPTFSGKIEEWIEFEDLFSAAIHKNKTLTNAQKLQYLKSSCKSDALDIIHSISICDANYDIAWNLLVERYSNKKDLINSVIKKLLSLPQTCDSASSLLKFVDNINECIRSLKVLEQNVNGFSDTLILYVLVEKLDKNTRSWWERSLKKDEIGTTEQLTSFLKEHSRTLQHNKPLNRETKRSFNSKALTSLSENSKTCSYCKGDHILLKCNQFLNLSVKKRFNFVKAKKLCFNCLSSLHAINSCKSINVCKKCHKCHHTLLHLEKEDWETANAASSNSCNVNHKLSKGLSPDANVFTPSTEDYRTDASGNKQPTCNSSSAMTTTSGFNKQVILSTAIIHVENINGSYIACRSLLDNGSQNNFMSKECVQSLNLRGKRINALVSGLNGVNVNIKESVVTTIANADRSYVRTLNFYVVPKITRIIPARHLNITHLTVLRTIKVADPEFYKPGPIHVLLSNEVFFELLGTNKIKTQELMFHESVFGYIASGSMSMPQENNSSNYCGHVNSVDDLPNTLKSFWEIEEVHGTNQFKSKEELFCEEHFLRTHYRREDGRYVVELPIKDDGLTKLGESKENAEKRLNYLLKRFSHNSTLKTLYEEFINEYEALGHSEEISNLDNARFSYYMPHHGIYRPDRLSTKLRVVFDASSATTSGLSLNDILLNGGIVQDELFDIICRFRTHKFVFTADIIKMYRQILIKDHQRDLLRILWKSGEGESLKIYRLNTITYGTSNAPYLATRTLNQLAIDEGKNFPLAAQVVHRDFYVDDVLTGAYTLKEAQNLQSQLIELLARGGFELHKWHANHPELLPCSGDNTEYSFNTSDEELNIKTLGLRWNPRLDCFHFKSSVKEPVMYTKRTVLSDIARIYDPLGLLAPGIIKAKIFIQRLWLLKLEWNEPLPENIIKDWQNFTASMQSINKLRVNRYVLCDNYFEVELHGFCDASEHAYGAAIYLRCVTNANPSSNLFCSKTRVAPLKPLSVPRLELCAALLLSQLVSKVVNLLNLTISKTYLWSDSTIVLAWLQSSPHLLKTFCANRVSKIQDLTSNYQWNHVRSEENPADLASRGVNFDKLCDADLWWNGPSFLMKEEIPVITKNIDRQHLEETEDFSSEFRKVTDASLISIDTNDLIDSILNISNNYIKLLRILSYIFRFVWNSRKGRNSPHKRTNWVSSEELNYAENYLIREYQKREFNPEYHALLQGKPISCKSKLVSLNPFLDKDKVMRVAGRLKNANLSFSEKHQIILPAKGKLSNIIVEYYHKKYLHIGSQALLCCVRQKFWPIQGRNLTRKITHECVTCRKNNPVTLEQIMGSLPSERVNPSAPFNYVGTDFGGPFFIRYKGQRKGILNKVYLAIFVCFLTKAVHLELVSELTTAAFIATLKRFIARRGKMAVIFSDNAKNFVGANAELQKLNNLIRRPEESLANYLSEEGIRWKFIPPRTPNFGGLWEAGIKSAKYHLRRTVGNARLTFEELLTVVTQIESILNSRPITPLSSDINDMEALTPGHFLIGRPMTAIVEPELINVNENRLSRWQKISRCVQLIWNRWHREYLNTLQQRSKWQLDRTNLKIGTLVLVKEDGLPVNKWLLGRVVNVFPGPDGKVRVVNVQTAMGTIKRGIAKIAILPLEENSS